MDLQENNTIPIQQARKPLHEMRAEVLDLATRFAGLPGIEAVEMHYKHDGLYLRFKFLRSGKEYDFTLKRAGNATPTGEDAA